MKITEIKNKPFTFKNYTYNENLVCVEGFEALYFELKKGYYATLKIAENENGFVLGISCNGYGHRFGHGAFFNGESFLTKLEAIIYGLNRCIEYLDHEKDIPFKNFLSKELKKYKDQLAVEEKPQSKPTVKEPIIMNKNVKIEILSKKDGYYESRVRAILQEAALVEYIDDHHDLKRYIENSIKEIPKKTGAKAEDLYKLYLHKDGLGYDLKYSFEAGVYRMVAIISLGKVSKPQSKPSVADIKSAIKSKIPLPLPDGTKIKNKETNVEGLIKRVVMEYVPGFREYYSYFINYFNGKSGVLDDGTFTIIVTENPGTDCWDRQRIKRKATALTAKLNELPVLEREYILNQLFEEFKK